MNRLIENFLIIWDNNRHKMRLKIYQLENYLIIIHKLRCKINLTIKDINVFIDLIETMAETIYTSFNCSYKYNSTFYSPTITYDEYELNTCSELLNYLELKYVG